MGNHGMGNIKKSFYLNYGGPKIPDGYYDSDNETNYPLRSYNDLCTNIDDANRKNYKVIFGESHFNIKGLKISVYTHGIHRSIKVSLPENTVARKYC